jgi:uncharacterized membrane protein YgcG
MLPPARLAVIAFAVCLIAAAWPGEASADEGWTIRSFDVVYDVRPDGQIEVGEDILADFGALQKHGIFREMPVRYEYDDDHDRLISLTNIRVDDGDQQLPFELISSDTRLQIKIGDPDVLVSGVQRYRISYLISGGMNAFEDHDEFYWNVTGEEWPVPIESTSASVRPPLDGINQVACFQGTRGSTEPCDSSFTSEFATFGTTRTLGSGSELTIVVGFEKGKVFVAPAVLVEPVKDELDQIKDAFDITPFTIGAAVLVLIAGVGLAIRQWWIHGRDRWYGEVWYVNDGRNDLGVRKPFFAREAVLTEFEPPPIEKNGRKMRPAEIGVLLDESADTLDVTATIIDLAVRGHIRITELESGGFLGLFKSKDYQIDKLIEEDDDLLPYEARTKKGLFGSKQTVKLSGLKNKFYKTLEKVKDALYDQMVKKNKLFPRSPTTSRTIYMIAGIVVMVFGVGAGFLLAPVGWSLLGIPIILVGIVVLAMSPAMPNRTAKGRGLYQRVLGFRRFMVTAETERQRFAERANIFHEYLPYAIVYKCVEKWEKAFEGLEDQMDQPDWYVGTRAFAAASFMSSMNDFSSSISNTIASTPGGSGGSGFGGGGGAGGGGGGGGGGSW